MATLRVWAHWIAAPGAPAGAPTARPVSFANYAGTATQLSVSGVAPQFVQQWAINPVVAVWAELAKQNDIDSASWGGAGWPGPPPVAWPPPPTPPVNGDEGYSAAAVAFTVTDVSVIMRDVRNTEFEFTIHDPANNIVGTVTPTSLASAPGVYPVTVPGGGAFVPVPDGKGIWTVDITRISGSAVAEPALYLGGPPGNLVLPPYVSPYGNSFEGILGLAFDGEEVTCPTVKTLTAEVEVQTPAGPVWQAQGSLTGADCVNIGQKVRLTATYANPPPLAGTNYDWDFGDSSVVPNTQHPVNSQEHAYAAAGSYAAAVALQILGCSTLMTKAVEVCWPCPTKVEIQPSPPQALPVSGCAPGSAAATFSVIVTWPAGPQPVPTGYTWVVNGPTGKYEITTSAPNVSTAAAWKKTSVTPNLIGPVDLSQPSPPPPGLGYSVSVTVNVVNLRPGCTLVDTREFNVPACVPCPQVSITAPSVTGCAPQNAVGSFTAQIPIGPGAPTPTGYTWTIGHAASGRQATVVTVGPTVSTSSTVPPWTGSLATGAGAVDLTTPDFYTVKVTAEYAPGTRFPPGCDPSTTLTFKVPTCAPPPTLSACSVTAGTPGTITATFDSAVDPTSAGNPANYKVSINGGAQQTPAAGTVSYDPTTMTTTLSGFNLSGGDTVVVTVTNVTDPSGTVTTPSSSTCSAPGGGGGDGTLGCGILLVLAIILLLLGAVVVVIGFCIGVPWVVVIGFIIGALGLILFILWSIFCSAVTPCSLMREMHCLLFWSVTVAPVVVAIAGALGGLPCGLAAAGAWGGWGTLYAWLGAIMQGVGCPPRRCF